MNDASRVKLWAFDYFMGLARRAGQKIMAGEPVRFFDRLQYTIGNFLFYGPLRAQLGMSRIRVAYTAGEAIGPDLFAFFRSIGINLKQLYGTTETAVFVCLQPDAKVKPDTVGIPAPGVEVKIAQSGELMVKSPGILKEYYKNPKATVEVLDADGWYHTGDAALVDKDGHIRIVDRLKDVGRLAGGPYDGATFAPKYVENKLKFSPYIKEVVAFGNARDRVCAFINIDLESVGNWAERRNLAYSGYTDLAQKPGVAELIRNAVESANAELGADPLVAGNQIDRFLILHKELDPDDGELTRTRKVRRGFIGERYGVLVEALFSGATEQYVETEVSFEDGRKGVSAATLAIHDAKTFAVLEQAA
jgi:long-chain acyl-CoA synthetase